MFVPQIVNAKRVARERPAPLIRNAHQKIGERVSRKRSVESEIASALCGVRGVRIVSPQQDSEFELMRAPAPAHVVVDLIFVVPKLNGAEGVCIEAEIPGNVQTGKAGELCALLFESADTG